MRLFRRRRKILLPLALLLIPLLLFLLLERAAAPVLLREAMTAAHAQAVRALNQSLAEAAAADAGYERLMHIERDGEGRILLIIPDSAALNAQVARLTLAVDSRLEELRAQEISLPLGIITGSRILAALGPRIRVRVRTLGALHAALSDELLSVGVNQSRHRISLQLSVSMSVVIPFHEAQFTASAAGLLCEGIIIGPVPQTYIDFSP